MDCDSDFGHSNHGFSGSDTTDRDHHHSSRYTTANVVDTYPVENTTPIRMEIPVPTKEIDSKITGQSDNEYTGSDLADAIPNLNEHCCSSEVSSGDCADGSATSSIEDATTEQMPQSNIVHSSNIIDHFKSGESQDAAQDFQHPQDIRPPPAYDYAVSNQFSEVYVPIDAGQPTTQVPVPPHLQNVMQPKRTKNSNTCRCVSFVFTLIGITCGVILGIVRSNNY